MFQAILRKRKIYLLLAVLAGVALSYVCQLPLAEAASNLPVLGENQIDLPKAEGGPVEIITGVIQRGVAMIKIVFEAVAVGFIVFVGAQMIFNLNNEDIIKEKQKTLLYAIFGFIVLNIGDIALSVFNPRETGGELIQVDVWRQVVDIIMTIIKYAMGAFSVVMLVLAGYKMISPSETQIAQQKKYIMWVAFGLFFILIADFVQQAVVPADYQYVEGVPEGGVEACERAGQSNFCNEYLANQLLLRFAGVILAFMGPVALFFLILAGVYFMTANGDETRLTRARHILIGTVVAVVMSYSAYALVSEIIRNVVYPLS